MPDLQRAQVHVRMVLIIAVLCGTVFFVREGEVRLPDLSELALGKDFLLSL